MQGNLSSYQYRDSHCGDNMITLSSYLHNGNPDEEISLYYSLIGSIGMDIFFFYIVRVINVYGPIQSYLELNKGHNKSYTQITRAYRLTLFRYRKKTGKIRSLCNWLIRWSLLSGYRKISNIRRTLWCNEIFDHSDVVGASPVGAAPTTFSFST